MGADPVSEHILTGPSSLHSPVSHLTGPDWSPEQCSWIHDKKIHIAVDRPGQPVRFLPRPVIPPES